MIKPDARFTRITDISVDFFKDNNIQGVILDLDNTLIDLNGKLLDGIEKWIKKMKDENIIFCIATNSINKQKVENIASKLQIPYVNISLKPFKRGVKKSIQILNTNNTIAEIGDQLFTDVWVSNRAKLFSILTEPISEDRFKLDKIKRKIEKWYLSKH